MFSKFVVKAVQVFVYPLVYLPFRVLYKKELKINSDLDSKEKYIFVANHPSRIDPFIMFYLLPFKEFIKNLPIRFMTAEKYMNNSLSFLFLSLLGCYPTGDDSIKKSIFYLENGNNLCIFIQGKIEKDFSSKPKVGAVYIERESKNSLIIPVRIKYQNLSSLKKKVSILFKDKIRHKNFPKDLQEISNDLLNKIKEG